MDETSEQMNHTFDGNVILNESEQKTVGELMLENEKGQNVEIETSTPSIISDFTETVFNAKNTVEETVLNAKNIVEENVNYLKEELSQKIEETSIDDQVSKSNNAQDVQDVPELLNSDEIKIQIDENFTEKDLNTEEVQESNSSESEQKTVEELMLEDDLEKDVKELTKENLQTIINDDQKDTDILVSSILSDITDTVMNAKHTVEENLNAIKEEISHIDQCIDKHSESNTESGELNTENAKSNIDQVSEPNTETISESSNVQVLESVVDNDSEKTVGDQMLEEEKSQNVEAQSNPSIIGDLTETVLNAKNIVEETVLNAKHTVEENVNAFKEEISHKMEEILSVQEPIEESSDEQVSESNTESITETSNELNIEQVPESNFFETKITIENLTDCLDAETNIETNTESNNVHGPESVDNNDSGITVGDLMFEDEKSQNVEVETSNSSIVSDLTETVVNAKNTVEESVNALKEEISQKMGEIVSGQEPANVSSVEQLLEENSDETKITIDHKESEIESEQKTVGEQKVEDEKSQNVEVETSNSSIVSDLTETVLNAKNTVEENVNAIKEEISQKMEELAPIQEPINESNINQVLESNSENSTEKIEMNHTIDVNESEQKTVGDLMLEDEKSHNLEVETSTPYYVSDPIGIMSLNAKNIVEETILNAKHTVEESVNDLSKELSQKMEEMAPIQEPIDKSSDEQVLESIYDANTENNKKTESPNSDETVGELIFDSEQFYSLNDEGKVDTPVSITDLPITDEIKEFTYSMNDNLNQLQQDLESKIEESIAQNDSIDSAKLEDIGTDVSISSIELEKATESNSDSETKITINDSVKNNLDDTKSSNNSEGKKSWKFFNCSVL